MLFKNKFGIKSRNILLIYINNVFSGMLFFLPILALYIEQELFTVTNVALIFSIQAISIALFEYPTGAIADLLGRKKSMLIAEMAVILAICFLFIGGSMTFFVLYALFTGFGHSLYSGSDTALVYDTLKQEGKEKYFKKIIGVKYALWPVGASIGSIIGGYLAIVSFSFPIGLALIPKTISLLTTALLVEPKYEKETHTIFKHMNKSLKIIIKNKQLIILLLSALIFVGIGDSVHSLKPIFLEFKEVPISFFGYFFAISFALSSLGHYFSHDVAEKISDKGTIILGAALLTLSIFLSTFFGAFFAVFFLLLGQLFYGVGRPATEHLINLETGSSTRATVISGYNFMRHLGVAIFIPLIGFATDLYDVGIGFRLGAIVMFSIPILFLFLKNKK